MGEEEEDGLLKEGQEQISGPGKVISDSAKPKAQSSETHELCANPAKGAANPLCVPCEEEDTRKHGSFTVPVGVGEGMRESGDRAAGQEDSGCAGGGGGGGSGGGGSSSGLRRSKLQLRRTA
jgi:hypothetical protein